MTARLALALAALIGGTGVAAADKGEKKDDEKLRIHGRVFVRADAFQSEFSEGVEPRIASARVELDYRRGDWLRAVLEGELDGGKLKDAYVRVRQRRLAAQAGQFKPPGSAIDTTSLWTLPTSSRGLTQAVLERMQIGGRRPGLEASWNGPGRWDPRVAVGVFAATGAEGALVEEGGLDALNLAARASIERGPVEIGAFGELVSNDPGNRTGRSPWWVAGLDAALETTWCGQGARAWAEVMVGNHGYWLVPLEAQTFVEARLVGAWRRGGLTEGARYLEIYGLVGALDASSRFGEDDTLAELTAGVSVGAWRVLRVSLELGATRWNGEASTFQPLEPKKGAADIDLVLVDREYVRLFIGAAF